jgi:hypothetical protein
MVQGIEERAKFFDSFARFNLLLDTTCRIFNYVPAFSSNTLIEDADHQTFPRGF